MEVPMKAGGSPMNKEEETATLDDLSSVLPVSQFASTVVSAQDSSLPDFVTSLEDISANQEVRALQESSASAEATTLSCIKLENFTAEAMDVACNSLLGPHHIHETENTDAQPCDAQKPSALEQLPAIDALPLGHQQGLYTRNSQVESLSEEPLTQNSLLSSGEGELSVDLSEEKPQDINGTDWSISAQPQESMMVNECGVTNMDVPGAKNGPTNAMDATPIEATNKGEQPGLGSGGLYEQLTTVDDTFADMGSGELHGQVIAFEGQLSDMGSGEPHKQVIAVEGTNPEVGSEELHEQVIAVEGTNPDMGIGELHEQVSAVEGTKRDMGSGEPHEQVTAVEGSDSDMGSGELNEQMTAVEGANSDMGSGKLLEQVTAADTVAVSDPAVRRETEISAVSIHSSNFHECAIDSSEGLVLAKGSQVVVSGQTEGVEILEEHSMITTSGLSVAETGSPPTIPSVSILEDNNATLSTVMKGESDESDVAVGVGIQYTKDDIIEDAPQKMFDTEMKIEENKDSPPSNLYPALDVTQGTPPLETEMLIGENKNSSDSSVIPALNFVNDTSQKVVPPAEIEFSESKYSPHSSLKISLDDSIAIDKLDDVNFERKPGGGAVLDTGVRKLHEVEEETDRINAESQEFDMDVQDPEVLSQKSEGGLEEGQFDLDKDVPLDSEMLSAADDVAPEQPQPRKRGRKPGKKVVKKAEKEVRTGLPVESDPEKELVDSPSKHSAENEQKRELRKRGRKPAVTKAVQKEEEDVCFVCFDGGKLILCDKRSCPKAYHVECTGRESEFFEKRGQWFCGWHVCSQCSRSAKLNCYLCPSALCSICMKGANFLCIRKGRGLCEGCYPLVHMIEYNKMINGDDVQVDFNDKETYEGLFKEYWEELKQKISLTSTELEKASKAKEAGGVPDDYGTNNDAEDTIGDEDGGSSESEDRPPTTRHARLMKRKRLTRHFAAVEDASASEFEEDESDDDIKVESTPKKGRIRSIEFDGWVSKDLADLIKSLKEDPKKQLPIFGVKKLLWRYIDDNKLSNPRQRGQIVCDERLQKLFGKKHVGRFEMMKLINLHVASPNKTTMSKVREGDNDVTMELDDSDENQLGKKKSRRKMEDSKRMKVHPSDYAAVNVKNINLIYLKRSVLDELRNDPELENKAVGAFVRIRVPGSANKNDACYRLVQVVGVKQIYDAHDPEKVKDVILEILNLHKREEVTADLVSNQDLVEEECLRLRQSVRCGFIRAMRVGELEGRARALREAKVKDWREYELLRLSHLRDRASEKGRKKELRECVEKLQLLNTPEEKERLLKAPFDIDADPHMDPDYESDEEEVPADEGQGDFNASQSLRDTGFSSRYPERGNNTGSAEKHYNHRDAGNILEAPKLLQDLQVKLFPKVPKGEDHLKQPLELQAQGLNLSPHTSNDRSSILGQGKPSWGDSARGREQTNSWNQGGSFGRKEVRWSGNSRNVQGNSGWRSYENMDTGAKFPLNQGDVSAELALGPGFSPIHTPGTMSGALAGAPMSTSNAATMAVDDEKDKVWCYQDPTRTMQGPFTMEQLRRWEKTNLFPLDLRIWRVTESQDASILLSDALMGRFTTRGPLGLSQKAGSNSVPVGPTQGTHVNGFPVQGPTPINLSMGPPTLGPSVGNLSSGSTQGILANPMVPQPQRPNVQSFPISPGQALNVHGLPTGPVQGTNAHGFAAAPAHPPSVHGFPSQGSNIHSFAPAPGQGAYVNNLAAAPTQATTFNSPHPGPMHGPNVTGYPPNLTQGIHALPGQSQMAIVLPGQPQVPMGFPGHMQATNVMSGQAQGNALAGNNMQGPHLNNAVMGHAQGLQINNFPQMGQMGHAQGSAPGPVNSNFPQLGPQGMSHTGRDFRNAAMPNRPTNDWQETGRRPGPDRHFAGPAAKAMDGNDGGGIVIPSRSPWRAQGRGGGPRQDSREADNRGHFGHGQSSRGSDRYQSSEGGRFVPKKDLFCRYFSRGLCKKGQACDFRHH